MVVLVQATVLTVGINGRSEALCELPIRVVVIDCGDDAIHYLKNGKVDCVVSKLYLDDMQAGQFLKKLRAANPHIPTIAVVKAGDQTQEIMARSLGVSAVLTDDASNELFP